RADRPARGSRGRTGRPRPGRRAAAHDVGRGTARRLAPADLLLARAGRLRGCVASPGGVRRGADRGRRRGRRNRMSRRAPLALAAVLVLAGCATPLPVPSPDPVPAVPPPTLTAEQVREVLEEVGSVLEEAGGELDEKILARRVAGPALTIRTAEYTVNRALEDDAELVTVPTTDSTIVVPTTETWPRSVLVVTEQPEDLQSPRLLVLTQQTPRE